MSFFEIVFICTGNTCRSQMAEAITQHYWPRLSVASAGIRAHTGQPTSTHAQTLLKEKGIAWQGRSKRFVAAKALDKVCPYNVQLFGMTSEHVALLKDEFFQRPEISIALLDEHGDIADPYQGGLETYRQTMQKIEAALLFRFDTYKS